MIVTEEEAKTKRCQESYPAAQMVTTNPQPVGIAYAGYGAAYMTMEAPLMCLGSGCMAWRWHGWHITGTNSEGNEIDYVTQIEPVSLREGLTARRVGFCGKAGKL